VSGGFPVKITAIDDRVKAYVDEEEFAVYLVMEDNVQEFPPMRNSPQDVFNGLMALAPMNKETNDRHSAYFRLCAKTFTKEFAGTGVDGDKYIIAWMMASTDPRGRECIELMNRIPGFHQFCYVALTCRGAKHNPIVSQYPSGESTK